MQSSQHNPARAVAYDYADGEDEVYVIHMKLPAIKPHEANLVLQRGRVLLVNTMCAHT